MDGADANQHHFDSSTKESSTRQGSVFVRSIDTRSKKISLLGVLGLSALLLASSLPASAKSDSYSYADKVDLAGVAWVTVTDDIHSDLTIRVFDSDERSTWDGPIHYRSPGIELFYTRRERDPATGSVTEINYEGFSGGTDSFFDFDRPLSQARAAFSLDLYGYRCVYESGDPGGEPQGITGGDCVELSPATVRGDLTWIGNGPISRDASKGGDGQPPFYMFGAHTVQFVREAEVTGTVGGDGLDLAHGAEVFGLLLRGKYHEHMVSARPQE